VYGIASRAKILFLHARSKRPGTPLPWLLTPTNGSTALFDGIYLGISEARERAENKHRAMIIISDGGDNHSRYNLRETKSLLEEADVPVFAVMAGSSFELPEIFTGPKKKSDASEAAVSGRACVRRGLHRTGRTARAAQPSDLTEATAAAFLRPSTRRIFRGLCGPSAMR